MENGFALRFSLENPKDNPESVANRPLADDLIASIASLFIARIASRKPAAYLTQEAWLQCIPFYIDERAIVPRSFIAELLADGSFDDWLGPHTKRVLDLCTGNGSLAVLAAMTYPETTVVGADISTDALEVAKINVAKHGLQDRIDLVESDSWKALDGQIFDLILCNPPYVNSASMAALPAEYLAEPALALAGGTDGMDFIRGLLAAAPAHMSEHAVMILEIGNERAFFEAAFPDLEIFWLETSAGADSVLLITKTTLEDVFSV
jgi:ribosomal protein L3 glutamine methyltransferase